MSASTMPSPDCDDALTGPAEERVETIIETTVVDRSTTNIQFPSNPSVILQAAQFTLLFMATLYVTRAIVMPIVLAVLLKLLLQPGVRRLERLHIPRALAALVMIVAMFVLLVSTGTALSGPAHEWAAKLPEGLPRLRERLNFISGPVETLQHFLQDAESYVHMMTSQGDLPTAAASSSGLSGLLVAGTASFASGLFTTILILFFLLISGDLFLRRLVEVLPRFRDKRTAVMISKQIEGDVALYLMTVTIMNVSVGVATALVMLLTGVGNPLLWGVLAFLLNYIPVIGPMICLVLVLLAGLLTIDSPWGALLPAAGFFTVHALEGQFITPLLVARRFTLNPAVVIISLVFWYWMWGIPGAILAVPVLGIVKIVCDGIGPWAAIGHLIEG